MNCPYCSILTSGEHENNCSMKNTPDNWKKEFDERYNGEKGLWRKNRESVDELRLDLKSFIRNLLSQNRQQTLEEVDKALEAIKEWPEPQPGAGEGLGPLAGTGMIMQYQADREKHKAQIGEVQEKVRELEDD